MNKTIFIFVFALLLMMTSCSKVKLEEGSVVDHEGNEYKTVLIDGIWWMTENMCATTLPNGENIVRLPSNNVFSEEEPMCYYVDDNEETKESMGCYYNYEAARQICPFGWRLPSENEYKQVQEFLYDNFKVPVQAAASKKGWEGSEVKDTPGYQSQQVYIPVGIGVGGIGIGSYFGVGENKSGHNNKAKLNWMPTGYWMYYLPETNCSVSFDIGKSAMLWLSDTVDNLGNAILLRYDQTDFEEVLVGKQNGVAVRCIRDAGSTEY